MMHRAELMRNKTNVVIYKVKKARPKFDELQNSTIYKLPTCELMGRSITIVHCLRLINHMFYYFFFVFSDLPLHNFYTARDTVSVTGTF